MTVSSKFKIVRKIPRYDNAGVVGDPKANGEIQGIGMEPLVASSPGGLGMPGLLSPNDALSQPGLVNPLDQDYSSINAELQDLAARNTISYAYSRGKNESLDPASDPVSGGSVETNVYDFTSMPGNLGAEDIGSRFMRAGQTLGLMGTDRFKNMRWDAKAATIGSGVMSALSGGMGIYRNFMSGVSSARAAEKDAANNQRRMEKQRFESQVTYDKGGTYLGPGNEFGVKSLTGEYIYPLPKSMEDQANVEVEKGEYVMRPGDTPSEALGQKHSKGGTKVALEEGTRVISDSLKIGGELASFMRDRYGMKVKPTDTYASLLDKYKSKIGLKTAYADQEKALTKLKENQKVKDANTRRMNESMLSKALNESNEDISGMERMFTAFAKVVYDAQELSKDKDVESTYMAKGGEVDKALETARRKYGFSEDDMAELRKRIVRGIRRRQEMDNGGLFGGRKLTFRTVANKYNNESNDFGYQGRNANGTYGRVNDAWLTEMRRLNPLIGDVTTLSGTDVNALAKTIQNVYGKQANAWLDLSSDDNSIISNAEELRNYATLVGFGGQDNPNNYNNRASTTFHSRAMDNKLGEFHLSRPTISLDVVTPDQLKKLNDAGITNFSQLFTDANKKKAEEILGVDMGDFNTLRDMYEGLDFVLASYDPAKNPPRVSGIEVNEDDPALPTVDIIEKPEDIYVTKPVDESGTVGTGTAGTGRVGVGSGMFFPELLRMTPSAVVTEGLERYRAPQVDPVWRSPDAYMAEQNRVLSSQLDQLQSVPDSQRGAIMSNLQAIMGDNVAKYMNEVGQANVNAVTNARNTNAALRAQAEDRNIQERIRYQTGILKGNAINEENWARYYDNINQEAQQRWNARTSMNTLRSIFGDVTMSPSGRMVVTPQGDIVNPIPTYMMSVPDESVRTTRTTTTTNDGKVRKTTTVRNQGR